MVSIPIIDSSFLTSNSYFQTYWPWFAIIGAIFIGMGIKILISALKLNKIRGLSKGWHELLTEGPYEVMRHPIYSAWAIIFIGLAFVFDSIIALMLAPFLVLISWLDGYLEERFILMPKLKEKYLHYKIKTPNRLFPPPYNALIIIISIFAIYVGVLNFIVL